MPPARTNHKPREHARTYDGGCAAVGNRPHRHAMGPIPDRRTNCSIQSRVVIGARAVPRVELYPAVKRAPGVKWAWPVMRAGVCGRVRRCLCVQSDALQRVYTAPWLPRTCSGMAQVAELDSRRSCTVDRGGTVAVRSTTSPRAARQQTFTTDLFRVPTPVPQSPPAELLMA